MKHVSILKIHNINQITDDIQLHNAIQKEPLLKTELYFDTSSIIKMLVGMGGLFKGVSKINWDDFHSHSTIVHALAYNNRLGPIHTLPPHTAELLSKIQAKTPPLEEWKPDKYIKQQQEFWVELDTKFLKLEQDRADFWTSLDWVADLKAQSVDFFRGVYCGADQAFWKYRYKNLREKDIIRFLTETDYNLGDMQKSPLFAPLLRYLNEKRRERSSNNYIDTISLCLLDEKLRQFQLQQSSEGVKALPLFFSDQEHILDAVLEFSQKPDREGRRPFIYKATTDLEYCIVRDANFFIITGIFHAIKNPEPNEDLKVFSDTLINYVNAIKDSSNNPSGLSSRQDIAQEFQKTQVDLEARSEEKILLEFFDRWWLLEGFEELKKVLDETHLNKNRLAIDEKVLSFVENERKRLDDTFSGYHDSIDIIRKAWRGLHSLHDFIKTNFSDDKNSIDIYKEIGPRFAFPEQICEDVQSHIDRIFESAEADAIGTLEDIKGEVVTDLISGLFDKASTIEEETNKINRLGRALAVLWIFEKYDLIYNVCNVVRKQYEATHKKSGDKYPCPTIAFLHAAAQFLGRTKDEEAALRIIDCVRGKYDNYKIWVSFSYLYYLLWDCSADNFDFPELSTENTQTSNIYNRQYLEYASEYSRRAIEWLEERRKDPEQKRKQKYRQRIYYYALNNYIFFQTITASSIDFLKLNPLVDKLAQSSRNLDYWQEDRFSDTLSRYYRRMAFLHPQAAYNHYLLTAYEFNVNAIKFSKRQKNLYKTLQLQLNEEMTKRGLVVPLQKA
jgi:hypothetical protein